MSPSAGITITGVSRVDMSSTESTSSPMMPLTQELTTTTAPHAMSYKLTSMYGIPHGHAVALCMPYCWRVLLERGDGELQGRLKEIATLMTGYADATPGDGLDAFGRFFGGLGLDATVTGKPGDVDMLVGSVNPQRLSNFPISLSRDTIESIYQTIVLV